MLILIKYQACVLSVGGQKGEDTLVKVGVEVY